MFGNIINVGHGTWRETSGSSTTRDKRRDRKEEEGKKRERRRIDGEERERERDCQTHRQSVRAEDGQGRSEEGLPCMTSAFASPLATRGGR